MTMLNIKAYENIKTTTITAITCFDGVIDRIAIAQLLPIFISDHKPIKTPRSKKIILPIYSTPNKIIAIKWLDKYRCQYKIKSGWFPNSVEIIMSTGMKNINIKVNN